MSEHSTDDELSFISDLYRKHQGPQRIEVFRTYVQALRHRTHWGSVDADRVLAFAEECLQQAWLYEAW